MPLFIHLVTRGKSQTVDYKLKMSMNFDGFLTGIQRNFYYAFTNSLQIIVSFYPQTYLQTLSMSFNKSKTQQTLKQTAQFFFTWFVLTHSHFIIKDIVRLIGKP